MVPRLFRIETAGGPVASRGRRLFEQFWQTLTGIRPWRTRRCRWSACRRRSATKA
jgi:hypothetical protein